MYQDASSTCRAIVIIITPFVFFKMSLTCRDNFVFVKNVMTFKTCPLVRIGPKTKLSRQVRDILKKTKGVIIITIALHVLLASWYISRHGRLVQISNQPRSQGLSLPAPKSERRETLVAAGHVIWVTNQNRREGCSSTKFCPPYKIFGVCTLLHCDMTVMQHTGAT